MFISGYFPVFQSLATWGYIFGYMDLGWSGASLVDGKKLKSSYGLMVKVKALSLIFFLFDIILLDSYPCDLRIIGHEAAKKCRFRLFEIHKVRTYKNGVERCQLIQHTKELNYGNQKILM